MNQGQKVRKKERKNIDSVVQRNSLASPKNVHTSSDCLASRH